MNCAIDYYLTFDNVKVGEAQGSYVAAHLPAGRKARIVRGTQAMTVYKPLKNLAALAARVAVEVAKGIKPAATSSLDNGAKQVPSIFEKIIAVDKDNLMSTVVADGFHQASELAY